MIQQSDGNTAKDWASAVTADVAKSNAAIFTARLTSLCILPAELRQRLSQHKSSHLRIDRRSRASHDVQFGDVSHTHDESQYSAPYRVWLFLGLGVCDGSGSTTSVQSAVWPREWAIELLPSAAAAR
jgi:hypothetical protein